MQSSQPGVVVLDSVDAHRGDRLALDGVSIAVPMGSIAAVMGPNGSGKSTLFGVISGRLRHSTGSVSVGGEVAEVLQTGGIDTHLPLTVEDVVRQGRYRSRGLLRPMTRDDRRLIREAIDVVDLAAHRRTPHSRLVGWAAPARLLGAGHRAAISHTAARRTDCRGRCQHPKSSRRGRAFCCSVGNDGHDLDTQP